MKKLTIAMKSGQKLNIDRVQERVALDLDQTIVDGLLAAFTAANPIAPEAAPADADAKKTPAIKTKTKAKAPVSDVYKFQGIYIRVSDISYIIAS